MPSIKLIKILGMGDEDEDQPESNLVWLNYFLKPIENASQIICTEKANGEAAHLSARFIKNKVSILGVGVSAWFFWQIRGVGGSYRVIHGKVL